MYMWNVKDLEVELCVTNNVRTLKGNLRERPIVKNLMRKLPITKHVYIGNQIENQRQYIPIRGKEIKENAISHTRTASKGWLVLLDIHLVLFLKKKNGLEGKDM